MICRHSFANLAGLVLACASLSGCEQPENNLSAVEKARVELANGNALSARVNLDRALREGAARGDLALLFAHAAMIDGDFVAAREWLAPTELSGPTRAEGFRLLGQLEMQDGNLSSASQAFDRSYQVDPENADLWVDIGHLRYRGGEQLQAIEAVERALALDPENGRALQFRGQLARDAEGLETGADFLHNALKRRPTNLELQTELAATLGDGGRMEEALRVLRGDAGKAASAPAGLFVQAVLAARAGYFGLSGDLLEQSGLVRTGVPSAQLLSAIIDLEQERYASALQTLDRLSSAQPDNHRIRDLLAYALSRSGGEQELVNRFARLAADSGCSAYLRILVGRAYEALGERESAAVLLDLAASAEANLSVLPSMGPANAPAVSGRVGGLETRDYLRNAIAERDTVQGARVARDFAQRFPGSSDALAILGDAELAQGNKRAARAAYERSAVVRRSWPLTLRLVGAHTNRDDARRLLENFVREHPMNGQAAAVLADALAQEGDWERAVRLLDHAMELGMARVPWVLAARSVGALQLDDGEMALQFALAAHDLQPMNPLAISALIAALPADEYAMRQELEAKLRSLNAN